MMIPCRYYFDLSIRNFRFWKISAIVFGALNLIGNIWLVYEFLITPEPLESNAAYLYVNMAYVFYLLRWIMGIAADFIEIFIKVLVGQFANIIMIQNQFLDFILKNLKFIK